MTMLNPVETTATYHTEDVDEVFELVKGALRQTGCERISITKPCEDRTWVVHVEFSHLKLPF
jgi:hypothetical protein